MCSTTPTVIGKGEEYHNLPPRLRLEEYLCRAWKMCMVDICNGCCYHMYRPWQFIPGTFLAKGSEESATWSAL